MQQNNFEAEAYAAKIEILPSLSSFIASLEDVLMSKDSVNDSGRDNF